ncbi:MAG: hypothetical protein KJO33_05345 [Gammaproteobacteria bacterium]|nr:hypothetical protein [Gammaproteobacteria bacterium]
MMKRIARVFVLLALFAAAGNAGAETLVREFSGSRSLDTAAFEVRAPWLIDWRVNSDFPQAMGIAVALVDAGTGVHKGRVLKTKSPGNGVRLIDESGSFRFKVDAAVANWRLKVIQLTEEEAELYTPVGGEADS